MSVAEMEIQFEENAIIQLLSDPELEGRPVAIKAGEVLYEGNTPATECYLIQSGEIRLFWPGPQDTSRLVNIMGPGNFIGLGAVAGLEKQGFRAVAVSDCRLLAVRGTRFLESLSGHPAAIAGLIRYVVSLLRRQAEDISGMAFEDCRHRLLRTLLRFSKTAAATPCDEGIILRITHEQLAQAVGAARETVSLTLTELRQAKLLRTGRNRLIFDPQALQAAAEKQ
ncbi:MAG TPA: Crp/Fnr family transcriptional regulator [Tepidisphaeraceae bacterium]|nr:Crp/Fnr family transcriptional regulator [Tepidisphaeraceae bacterium]